MLVDFTLDEQERCVQGHFPDSPLVPGAWLLAKIDLCLRAHLPERRVAGFSKVKFIAPLLPGMAAQLEADLSAIADQPASQDQSQIQSQTAAIKVRIRNGEQLILEARAQLI